MLEMSGENPKEKKTRRKFEPENKNNAVRLVELEKSIYRRSQGGDRRSHNQRADGGALINYNDPSNAGLSHKGVVCRILCKFH